MEPPLTQLYVDSNFVPIPLKKPVQREITIYGSPLEIVDVSITHGETCLPLYSLNEHVLFVEGNRKPGNMRIRLSYNGKANLTLGPASQPGENIIRISSGSKMSYVTVRAY